MTKVRQAWGLVWMRSQTPASKRMRSGFKRRRSCRPLPYCTIRDGVLRLHLLRNLGVAQLLQASQKDIAGKGVVVVTEVA